MRCMVLAVVLLAGCGKGKAPAPALDPPKAFALTGLKLAIDAPGNAILDRQTDDDAQMTWPSVRLSIRNNHSGLNASSLERAAADVTSARITKQERTADGWELRYDETLGGDQLFTVAIHRTIAEVSLECVGSSPSPVGADSVAVACATLRPR